MGITEKEETQKLYYSITEVSEMFELNASTLRFWEKEFDVLKPTKNKKGNRLFTQKDIDLLQSNNISSDDKLHFVNNNGIPSPIKITNGGLMMDFLFEFVDD